MKCEVTDALEHRLPLKMSFLGQIADTWQALIDLIIRPPRHEYSVNRDLGPRRLVVKGGLVIREDIEVHDRRIYCQHRHTHTLA